MYAPTLDQTNATHGTDLDSEFRLIIDQFDTWSIGDIAAAMAGPSSTCWCYHPIPGSEETL